MCSYYFTKNKHNQENLKFALAFKKLFLYNDHTWSVGRGVNAADC